MAQEGINDSPPVFIRKSKSKRHKKHSGAWKIAYADFVTAMMAFFLLMWLMGTTSKSEQSGISEFFKNPISINKNNSGSNPNPIDFNGSAKSISSPKNTLEHNARTEDISLKKKYLIEHARKIIEEEQTRIINRLKNEVESSISENKDISEFKDQVLIEVTQEGLMLQVIDKENRPMFESGQDKMKPYTSQILRKMSELINKVENKIRITGHTDSDPYTGANEKYGNWDLSSKRAIAAMHVMVDSGLNTDRIDRISGVSDTQPLVKENPFSVKNRRITILVLKKSTE